MHHVGDLCFNNRFKSAEEAAAAYDQAVDILHNIQGESKGRKHIKNFPDKHFNNPVVERKVLESIWRPAPSRPTAAQRRALRAGKTHAGSAVITSGPQHTAPSPLTPLQQQQQQLNSPDLEHSALPADAYCHVFAVQRVPGAGNQCATPCWQQQQLPASAQQQGISAEQQPTVPPPSQQHLLSPWTPASIGVNSLQHHSSSLAAATAFGYDSRCHWGSSRPHSLSAAHNFSPFAAPMEPASRDIMAGGCAGPAAQAQDLVAAVMSSWQQGVPAEDRATDMRQAAGVACPISNAQTTPGGTRQVNSGMQQQQQHQPTAEHCVAQQQQQHQPNAEHFVAQQHQPAEQLRAGVASPVSMQSSDLSVEDIDTLAELFFEWDSKQQQHIEEDSLEVGGASNSLGQQEPLLLGSNNLSSQGGSDSTQCLADTPQQGNGAANIPAACDAPAEDDLWQYLAQQEQLRCCVPLSSLSYSPSQPIECNPAAAAPAATVTTRFEGSPMAGAGMATPRLTLEQELLRQRLLLQPVLSQQSLAYSPDSFTLLPDASLPPSPPTSASEGAAAGFMSHWDLGSAAPSEAAAFAAPAAVEGSVWGHQQLQVPGGWEMYGTTPYQIPGGVRSAWESLGSWQSF